MHVKSNRAVCIKMIEKKTDELAIGRYLVPDCSQSPQTRRDHCVPILDAFQDPISPDVSYIVMPLLRAFDDPEFGAVGEVVDLVTQLLEVRQTFRFIILDAHQLLITGHGIYA